LGERRCGKVVNTGWPTRVASPALLAISALQARPLPKRAETVLQPRAVQGEGRFATIALIRAFLHTVS